MKMVAQVINKMPSVGGVVRQFQFGTAVGLTRLAKHAQKDIKQELRSQFTIRNKWPDVGPLAIRITPATKNDLTSEVKTAAGFLRPHEEGTAKTPLSGKSIAVPTENVRRNKRLIIPRGQRPKGLGGKAFVLETKHGPVLAQRITRGPRKGLVVLYGLEPSVRIKKRSTFNEPARKAAKQHGPRFINEGIHYALKTAK